MRPPIIILVRPQMVENIGMVARAMLNCRLSELRLVAPRDPWPLAPALQERVEASASGATAIFHTIRIFETLAEAVADCHTVYASSARPRDMVKEVVAPRHALVALHGHAQAGEKTAILFGPERTGLTNEDLLVAEKIVTIPSNPDYSSLNLAQSVLVMAYEWLTQVSSTPETTLDYGKSRPATKAELFHFFDHLERELEAGGFYVAPDMKPTMVQNARNTILRAGFTEQEVRTWHGMIAALVKAGKGGRA